jgi:hypothetical protein
MAVKDDLRRLSEMQATYLSWQSFFAQLCAADSPGPNSDGEQEDLRNASAIESIAFAKYCSLAVREMGRPANVENRLSASVATELDL